VLGRKKKQPRKFEGTHVDTLVRRLQHMDKSEILDTLDTTLSVVCRYVPEYRRTRNNDLLAEAQLSLEAMYVMTTELLRRLEPPPGEDDTVHDPKQLTRQVTRDHY
jgi:hypothetical protein